MKKLLALVMVLGLAMVASASDVNLSANGAPIAGDVDTGSVISGVLAGADNGYTLEISIADGTLDTSGMTFAPGFLFGNKIVGAATETWVRVSGSDFMPKQAGQALFDGLVVNLNAGVDVAVVTVSDKEAGTLSTFNVVPEPMTMSLLGLGGLALIRRRRA
jgi:hypothetical protein